MKVLVHGDLFITNEVLQAALEEVFQGTGISFTYECLTCDWPVEPITEVEDVRECVGSPDEICARVADVDLIVTHSAPITRRVIEAAPRLRAVGAARGGPVNISVQACTERGIPVFYAPGRNSGAVAEFTMGMILAATRNIVRSHVSLMRDRQWRGDLYVLSEVGTELSEATVGVVGFGAIGSKVARLCQCFGARVLVYDPYVPAERIREAGHEPVSLEDLLRRSDLVTLHVRLTPESRRMIGAREIGWMKPTAYLINTARGGLVDHGALYQALKERRIAGAALDVFEAEPPPDDSPLFSLENVVATSHLAGASRQAAAIGARVMAEELRRYLTGEAKPRFCMNPEVLDRYRSG